jgi:hypothetical protein
LDEFGTDHRQLTAHGTGGKAGRESYVTKQRFLFHLAAP